MNSAWKPECLWFVGAELGEGPVWLADSGSLYFVDILRRRLHRCDALGQRQQSWEMPARLGFVLPLGGGSGDLLLGLQGSLQRFNPHSSELQTVMEVEAALPGNRSNDGHVDAQGRLWFGTMHLHAAQPTGWLYRLSAGGELLQQDGPYACTNGPAFSPDGRTAYHTDTMRQLVYAFDVSPEGDLSGKRLFARVTAGYPDGMAVDEAGDVWIGLYGGGAIERYSAQGRLLQTLAFPCRNVTKLCFGGPDRRTAFVTTARAGLTPVQLAREPLAGGLFGFRVDTPGLPQHSIQQGIPA